MRISSILFLVPAGVLSLALMPDDMALIPVFSLSFLRSIALIVGFLCLVASGRLDRWSSSRTWLAFLVTGGVAVLTFVCMSWQIAKEDLLPLPYSVIYIVLARVLPIGLMASAFLPSKKTFLSCVACAFVAGVVFDVTMPSLSEAYAEQKAAAHRAEYEVFAAAEQARLEGRLAALSRVPADSGAEPLLAFVDEHEPSEVQRQAIARLDEMPNAAEQLARLLDGDRRLDALVALNLGGDSKFTVPDAIKQRGWIAAGLIAGDMTARMGKAEVSDDDVRKLCRSLSLLSTFRDAALAIREEHRAELVALRDWLRVAPPKLSLWCGGGPATVDSILEAP